MEREAAFRQKVADSGEISGEVRYLPYKADAAEKRKFASELFRDVSANSAVIGVNAPLIQAVFHGEIRDVPVFCIDHVPKLHELNVTGFAQPIAEMADCAVQMLKNQCRKGKKWQCEHRRFKGVTVAP
jgi:DNA-binding LacI/PurR family transcriptional regulator